MQKALFISACPGFFLACSFPQLRQWYDLASLGDDHISLKLTGTTDCPAESPGEQALWTGRARLLLSNGLRMMQGDLSATVVTASEVSPGAHLQPGDTTTAAKSHPSPGFREMPMAGTEARAPPAAREAAGSCKWPHLKCSFLGFHI